MRKKVNCFLSVEYRYVKEGCFLSVEYRYEKKMLLLVTGIKT